MFVFQAAGALVPALEVGLEPIDVGGPAQLLAGRLEQLLLRAGRRQLHGAVDRVHHDVQPRPVQLQQDGEALAVLVLEVAYRAVAHQLTRLHYRQPATG